MTPSSLRPEAAVDWLATILTGARSDGIARRRTARYSINGRLLDFAVAKLTVSSINMMRSYKTYLANVVAICSGDESDNLRS